MSEGVIDVDEGVGGAQRYNMIEKDNDEKNSDHEMVPDNIYDIDGIQKLITCNSYSIEDCIFELCGNIIWEVTKLDISLKKENNECFLYWTIYDEGFTSDDKRRWSQRCDVNYTDNSKSNGDFGNGGRSGIKNLMTSDAILEVYTRCKNDEANYIWRFQHNLYKNTKSKEWEKIPCPFNGRYNDSGISIKKIQLNEDVYNEFTKNNHNFLKKQLKKFLYPKFKETEFNIYINKEKLEKPFIIITEDLIREGKALKLLFEYGEIKVKQNWCRVLKIKNYDTLHPYFKEIPEYIPLLPKEKGNSVTFSSINKYIQKNKDYFNSQTEKFNYRSNNNNQICTELCNLINIFTDNGEKLSSVSDYDTLEINEKDDREKYYNALIKENYFKEGSFLDRWGVGVENLYTAKNFNIADGGQEQFLRHNRFYCRIITKPSDEKYKNFLIEPNVNKQKSDSTNEGRYLCKILGALYNKFFRLEENNKGGVYALRDPAKKPEWIKCGMIRGETVEIMKKSINKDYSSRYFPIKPDIINIWPVNNRRLFEKCIQEKIKNIERETENIKYWEETEWFCMNEEDQDKQNEWVKENIGNLVTNLKKELEKK
jgi:hypothetical protein